MANIPPLDWLDLPRVLEILQRWNIRREDLISYLQSGNLDAVCFPYPKARKRKISITQKQWREAYRDAYEFSVYDGWLGDVDISELGTLIPLHILPDKVAKLKGTKHPDGSLVVTTAAVYIERDELLRFVAWFEAESRRIAPETENTPDRSDISFDQPSHQDHTKINANPSDAEKDGGVTDSHSPHVQIATSRKRQTDKLQSAKLKNRYQSVLRMGKDLYPDPEDRPSFKVMATKITGGPNKEFQELGVEAINKLLKGTYKPAKKLGLGGLSSLDK